MEGIKDLLLKHLRGELSERERADLEIWLSEKPEHRDLLEAVTDEERVRAAMEAFSQMDEDRVWRRLQSRGERRVRWVPYAWAAAVVALAIGIGIWIRGGQRPAPGQVAEKRYKNDVAPGRNAAVLTLAGGQSILLDSSGGGAISRQGGSRIINEHGQLRYDGSAGKTDEVVYNTLSTGRGNHYQLVLPDGSKVWLNAASSITYPSSFVAGDRRVSITGEAYFEIARDDQAPFIVQHQGMSIQVLGTQFNINSYDDEDAVRTTLLEGGVRIAEGASSKVLRPGQQGISRRGGSIAVDDHVDIEAVMAWKNDVFKFDDAKIEAVMRQLSRWYDVDVVYGSTIQQHFVADIPRNVPLSEVLRLLEMTDQVHFIIDGKKITVTQ